jgi:hypothetical protein
MEKPMFRSLRFMTMTAALLAASASFAQAPAGAPAGTTGICKDGSYYSGATKKGACHGHHGVKDWYGAAATAPAPAVAMAAGAGATAPAAPAVAAKPSMPAPAPAASMPATMAAPGGGAGMVWANSSSKVYHCPTDKWYGKTKQGQYMSEADAKSKGFHADHGKACS